jgi:ABC-type transport system involved in cytochrome bd biosynthesis fused ATPase/permease subunit
MIFNSIPLVDWTNGIVMIGVFALVVVILVAVMLNLMNSDKKRSGEE